MSSGKPRRPALPRAATSGLLYLMKDSNDLVSHCTCARALVCGPGQMSCPWCGCGWMMSCLRCRKAFTFARAEYTSASLEELARMDLEGYGITSITDQDIAEWVDTMTGLMAGLQHGRRYVYFDGNYLPADAGPIEIDGWFAHHQLPRLPQTAALENPAIIEDVLHNSRYWIEREVKQF